MVTYLVSKLSTSSVRTRVTLNSVGADEFVCAEKMILVTVVVDGVTKLELVTGLSEDE